MAYVNRDAGGSIVGMSVQPTPENTEFVADHAGEVVEYARGHQDSEDIREILRESDLAMARVIEDLIYTLIGKNVIMLTDLPIEAQQKLASRRRLRGGLSDLSDLVAREIDL